ncbi:MAG: hypothetical protein OXT74_07910 [Candidatus Poribacteria bacterium]|nr:hypothetical protein [Candidatus Poribacteria bacterium]
MTGCGYGGTHGCAHQYRIGERLAGGDKVYKLVKSGADAALCQIKCWHAAMQDFFMLLAAAGELDHGRRTR